MNKNIKLIIENLFDDVYAEEQDTTMKVMDEINEPIIQQTLQKLKLRSQKELKTIKIEDLDLLPDSCLDVTSGLFGKKQDVIVKNFSIFLKNLFKVFQYENATLNLNFLDVSGLTTFNSLFKDVYSDLKIDISRWDTKNVTDLSGCFKNSYLNECDISNWDVSNVEYLNYTFQEAYINCDLSNWKFTKLKELRHTFDGVKQIHFDFSKWNTSSVYTMSFLFANINFKNTHINIKPEYIENLDVSNCENFKNMFEHYNGSNLNLNNWTLKNTRKTFLNMFNLKSSKSIIDISDWINKLSIKEIIDSDSYIKKQLYPLLLNKITSSDLSINTLLLLTKYNFFRDALKNYKIKLEKIEDNI